MGSNGKEWDKIAILGIIVGAIVALATPELRQCIGLEEKPASSKPAKPAAAVQQPPSIHEEKEPSVPQEYTIGENKSEFVKEANTRLSVAFHNIGSEETASVTIAPSGKNAIILPTVGGGSSKEFTSSTGIFLISVLNVNWNSRTITVQVSRKL